MQLLHGLKVFAARALQTLCRFFIFRNKKWWIFGSRFGRHYNENSKHLFEYVNRTSTQGRPIWMTRDPNIFNDLRSRGYEVCMSRSLKGIFCSLRAGAAIVSISPRDVNNIAAAGARLIQLWHGTPLKVTDVFGDGDKYDMVILAAEEYLHNRLLGNENNSRFVLTGYPRNDCLLSPEKIPSMERLKDSYGCDKIVLYLPTYRDRVLPDGSTCPIEDFELFDSFGFDQNRLEQLMRDNNALFVLNLHPAQRPRAGFLEELSQNSRYVHVIDPENPFRDVNEYLKYTDILITDYSSVYFDFLLVDRPIIFTPFDYEDYVACRPLGFSYEEVTPGPKARNWGETLDILQEILDGRDDWQDFRRAVNRRFNAFQDANSSERVYREVSSILGLNLS
jgi:CDP-glycerol glycerophosphotransferase (TagB/SpsB family)